MKKLKELLQKPWFAYTFALCTTVILYLLLTNAVVFTSALRAVLKLFAPIILGLIVAYLLNPVSEFFKRTILKKIKKESTRHTVAVILVAVCALLLIALLLIALIPSLVESISKLINEWPSYAEKLENLLDKIIELAAKLKITLEKDSIIGVLDNAVMSLTKLIKDNGSEILSAVGSIGGKIGNFLIAVLFGFCFLFAKKTLVDFATNLRRGFEKEARINRANEILNSCHHAFIKYVGCTLIDALIIGVVTLVFMLIFKMPYAPLIAVIVAICNIIPTFGPIIGGVLGAFFLILDKPVNALIFIIFFVILQLCDAVIIKPRMFSGSLGIPGVWTLILIIFGSRVAGIVGILLAIPFAAVFVIIYNEVFLPKLQSRALKINKKEE